MKTALYNLVLASGLFVTALEGTVKITNASDGTCTICVVPPADVEVYIKQSTTETVALPSAAALSCSGTSADKLELPDADVKRWMASVMFRSYWDYRDTAYMIDALHFLVEKFFFDTVGALEDAVGGRSLSSAQQNRAILKILEQQMGKSGKFWFFGSSADDEWSDENLCEETAGELCDLLASPEEISDDGVAEIALASEDSGDSEGELFDLESNDESVAELMESSSIQSDEPIVASCEGESSSHGQDRPTFSNVIDFYHIVLHRIAHLLTPEGALVRDTMRGIEIDLMLVLNNVARHYDQQFELAEAPALDGKMFAKIKEAYGAMLLAGRDFFHEKLRAAWAPTINIVDGIVAKTGKNVDSLNYFDFEQWLNDQQQ